MHIERVRTFQLIIVIMIFIQLYHSSSPSCQILQIFIKTKSYTQNFQHNNEYDNKRSMNQNLQNGEDGTSTSRGFLRYSASAILHAFRALNSESLE